MDCLFCSIIKNETPANIIYRDDDCVAFADINPQAKHHLVIVPVKHIPTLNDIKDEDVEIVGHLIAVASSLAKQLGIEKEGYRVVMNCNSQGGQTIYHIHLHLLGGRQMHWPPG